MIDQHVSNTRRQLGELGSMAQQTEQMERHIMSIATERLNEIESKMDAARADAMAGDDKAKDHYTDMVEERGRLQQVIARATQNLAA